MSDLPPPQGGNLAYWLQQQHPERVGKVVLVAPGLPRCIVDAFEASVLSGTGAEHAWETLAEFEEFFEKLGPPKMQRLGILGSLLAAGIVHLRQTTTPANHFRDYFAIFKPETAPHLYEAVGDPARDCATSLSRLVIWGDADAVCDYHKGKAFFEQSPNTKFVSVPDCGHFVLANWQRNILVHYSAKEAAAFLY